MPRIGREGKPRVLSAGPASLFSERQQGVHDLLAVARRLHVRELAAAAIGDAA
jgi:hypothetical protein